MTDIAPARRVDDCPYSPRMLRIIANAQRLNSDVSWTRGVGFGYLTKSYVPSHPHVRFAVEGNRLRLLPRKVKQL